MNIEDNASQPFPVHCAVCINDSKHVLATAVSGKYLVCAHHTAADMRLVIKRVAASQRGAA